MNQKNVKMLVKITTVLRALQISKEIKQLYKHGMIEPQWSSFLDSYGFTKISTTLYTWKKDKHFSADKYVPVNLWTILIGTAGNRATIHSNWTAELYNSGFLSSEYTGQHTYTGLPARIIYTTMRRMYKKHKQSTRQR